MSGQYNPEDTGRAENPAETDWDAGECAAKPEDTLVGILKMLTCIADLHATTIENQHTMIRHLERLAERH